MIRKVKNLVSELIGKSLQFIAKLLYSHSIIIENKIVIDNFLGKGYGDNPKCICEALLKKNTYLDIVWVCKDLNSVFPSGVRIVKYGSLKSLKEYYTAKVWIDNVRNSFKPSKRERQYYIQTWHGNLGNKLVEGAAIETLPRKYVITAKKDAAQTDLMISGSVFFTNLIRDHFWYNGRIMEIGTPRLDVFFQNKSGIIENVKKQYGIDTNTNVILYAPTFRNSYSIEDYDLDYQSAISAFERLYRCKCLMIIRFHPNLKVDTRCLNLPSNVINVSDYPDVYELVISSNAIITDYSSISIESGVFYKPVFIYANDIDEYTKERGFISDINKQPFPISRTNGELVSIIENFNFDDYASKLKLFNNQLGIKEYGTASKALSEVILNVINNS